MQHLEIIPTPWEKQPASTYTTGLFNKPLAAPLSPQTTKLPHSNPAKLQRAYVALPITYTNSCISCIVYNAHQCASGWQTNTFCQIKGQHT
eukprot:8664267-Ditylum_brightwellii.AAC.1